jgi:serine/threonine protein kinase
MDLVGKTLGQYQIIEELGRGGMAVVYKAYQPSLNRYVAIKVLPPQFAFDEQFVQRFLREARGAAALHHPNIVTIHDVNQQDSYYFIVMEYVQGETLDELLARSGPLPLPRIGRIVSQVADALEHAHQQGLIHRDIKPSNIMVDEQRNDSVTLMDFGLVRAAEGTGLTRTGTIVGTPEYMSPEQGQGESVDSRTDIYSLGVVIFKMLTGHVPFTRSTPHAVLIAHITQEPPSITSITPSLPRAVEAVVRKAMAKDRESRYTRASELARDLETAATGQVPAGLKAPRPAKATAPPPERTQTAAAATAVHRPSTEKARGKGWLWGLGAVGALLLLGVCGALAVFAPRIFSSSPSPSPAPSATPVASVTPVEEPAGGTEIEVTMTPTATPTPKATSTRPPKATSTSVPSPTPTPTAQPTDTPAPTATSGPTNTPRPTNTPKPSCSISVVGPEDGAQFGHGQQISFHWTGSEPGDGEYYEVRVDGASIGAAWFNSALQQWEATWKATQGGHTWQVVLMASDRRTARCSGPVLSLNVTGGGGGGGGGGDGGDGGYTPEPP